MMHGQKNIKLKNMSTIMPLVRLLTFVCSAFQE